MGNHEELCRGGNDDGTTVAAGNREEGMSQLDCRKDEEINGRGEFQRFGNML